MSTKLRKCCVSEIVPDGRLIPFCAYNSVGYREQVRHEMPAARQPHPGDGSSAVSALPPTELPPLPRPRGASTPTRA